MKKAFWNTLEFIGDKPWLIYIILFPIGTVAFWWSFYELIKFLIM